MMHLDWLQQSPSLLAGDTLAVAVRPEELAAVLDRLGDPVAAAVAAARFKAKSASEFRYTRLVDDGLVTVCLLGVGDEPIRPRALRELAHRAGRAALQAGSPRLFLEIDPTWLGDDVRHGASLLAQGLELATYRYDRYLKEEDAPPPALEAATIVATGADTDAARRGLAHGQAVAAAIRTARDLGNGPAEVITPTALADFARERLPQVDAQADVEVEVLDREACERAGMGLFLAVAKGSDEPPRFIHARYRPKGGSRGRVVLVGKGVTFDSGGYSLKPSEAMEEMKLDMCGAAAVLAAFEGAVALGVPWEVHAIVAATENMVSGHAYRLGDVFTASNGTTVEINNTDAEGRLTLADALVFGAKLEPDLMVDFATLTGACMVALGPKIAGVMSPSDTLAQSWVEIGARAGEDMWHLPLPKELDEQLESKIADLKNTGERWGGALTAGLFLSRFVDDTPWIHVDIAGPAMASKPWGVHSQGGTGFAVASILELLHADELPKAEP